jgi:hypothetical protein
LFFRILTEYNDLIIVYKLFIGFFFSFEKQILIFI